MGYAVPAYFETLESQEGETGRISKMALRYKAAEHRPYNG